METKTKKGSVKKAHELNLTKTDLSQMPKLPKTLEVLQFLRTAKGKNDSDAHIHPMLDAAYKECKNNNIVLMLEKVMLYIGDISRQHNILRELGITSANGGGQERKVFRSCLRWWEKNLKDSFENNLHLFVEFTLYENLMYYQNTTDRLTGKLVSTEKLFPMPKVVYEFLATQIKLGKDLNLIARHLPKYTSNLDSKRKGSKKIKFRKNQKSITYNVPANKAWFKVNGVFTDEKVLSLNNGDIISYPRNKQNFTLEKEKFVNNWIEGFCKTMDWSIEDYNKFRSLQNTPEQLFASKSIMKLSQDEFDKFMNRLTSGQRNRVAKMLAYKTGASLMPKPKWAKIGQWYIDWETNQETIAEELRKVAMSPENEDKRQELLKNFKVKSTGMQTIDLLAEMFKGDYTDMQINNTYQALVEKMDLIANVFPIVDGSGSMNSGITHKGVQLSHRQIAYSMLIAFSTRNPVDAFRNTYGWFSAHFQICGRSNFVDNSPNPYVDKKEFTHKVKDHQVISETKTFTDNMKALAASDPKEVSSTNMFSSIDYFVKLVNDGKFNVEQLPSALLYITDNENNTGKSPKQAVAHAASIGWHPLLIFWGLQGMSQNTKEQLKGVPNCLFLGGFNEGNLSEILRGIKNGSINPEEELWSIYNNIRYSVLTA